MPHNDVILSLQAAIEMLDSWAEWTRVQPLNDENESMANMLQVALSRRYTEIAKDLRRARQLIEAM